MDVNKLHVSVSLYIPVIHLFCSFMVSLSGSPLVASQTIYSPILTLFCQCRLSKQLFANYMYTTATKGSLAPSARTKNRKGACSGQVH